MDLFRSMKARNIGPAGMSGRITAIDVDLSNPEHIYIGTASGGVWVSQSGGTYWRPLFQQEKAMSVGALAINQSNPSEIWVGTGEGNPRNSLSSGYGVYKSIDGGRSWQHLGLEKTRNIHRILIDPSNPQVVYAGAIGSPWGEHAERGVFKTTDGGKSWKKVLYVNEKTGVADLVMDPQNPNKLIAAMWEHRRWPWYFNSGGEGSGLYLSTDGGENWKQLGQKEGLPEGELGRIGLAIAASDPDRVYAWVEAKKNGLYRSEDGGYTWKLMADKNIGGRPFYYADIFVDPKNENRVYNLHTYVDVSEDGGKTFEQFINPNYIHVDNHAWWIHPENPNYLICGNDGGLAISRDRGNTWNAVENLPVGQFYHINVDNEVPYNIYGGMQDNGSWRGPSQVWRRKGIRNLYWNRIGYGDGFDALPDPESSRFGYSMSQGGNLLRYDLETGAIRSIRPFLADGKKLRFNWNAGLALDPIDSTTIYYGAQYVLRSKDKGDTWEQISPDLTTNDAEKQQQLTTGGLTTDNSGAENFTTILTISASPITKGVIWAGTDDGKVHVSTNGGEKWNDLSASIPDVPAGSWVTQIHASRFEEGEAIIVMNNYRRDDWTPYVYKVENFGKKWTSLVNEEQVWGYALSFVQDPIAPDLYFLGTEFGLYLSIDAGANWTHWTHGYPNVSTMDMVIHPREHDLVIGTFGRAIFVLDDIRPLREMAKDGAEKILKQQIHAFPAPHAWLAHLGEPNGYRSTGHGLFVGKNRPQGALISFYIRELAELSNGESSPKVLIEILNEEGKVIRNIKHNPLPGINRVVWNLDRRGVRYPNSPKPKPNAKETAGRKVVPGTYTARIKYNENESETKIVVKADPRIPMHKEEFEAKARLIDQHTSTIAEITAQVDRLQEAKASIALVNEKLKKNKTRGDANELVKMGEQISTQIEEILNTINPPKMQGFSRNDALLHYKLSGASRFLQTTLFPVTHTQELVVKHAAEASVIRLQQIADFFAGDWKAYKKAVKAADLPLLED